MRVLALPSEPTDTIDGTDAEVVRGDVLSREDCKRATDGVDTIFHAAAIYKSYMEDPTPMYDVNLRGTFNVLEAGRRNGVERTVYTASIVSLGRPPVGQLGDETTPYEAWDLDFAYSRSKYHSRVLAEDFANWGLDVRVVCPGIVFGPGDRGPTPSGQLIVNQLRQGLPIYVDGGSAYVDVRDAAEVHVRAAEHGTSGERYLAVGHNLTNCELQKSIAHAAGQSTRLRKIPTPAVRALVGLQNRRARKRGEEPPIPETFFEYGLKHSFYRNDKSIRDLGARYRPLDETIRDAIAYFRERGMV